MKKVFNVNVRVTLDVGKEYDWYGHKYVAIPIEKSTIEVVRDEIEKQFVIDNPAVKVEVIGVQEVV